ncbi:MAG: FMN-binding protein [Clostridia bacterium]|nr:FMN-binding protein [Clostridia bacterium]
MTKTMKNTLVSVLVMAIISVVAVGCLAVANAFFPEYEARLDKKTAALINQICPTGVSDAAAFSDGYYEMATVDKAQLKSLNESLGADKNNKVLAIYDVKKGDFTGYRVVESQAQGYGSNPVIITLTSFDKDNKIGKVIVKQQKENPTGSKNIFTGEYFDKFLEYVAGQKNVSVGDVTATTGATNASSIKGLVNAVNIAASVVDELFGATDPTPQPVTKTKLLNALKKVSSSTSFMSYPIPTDKKKDIFGIYKGDAGDVLVAGRGNGYGGTMGLLVKIDADGKIEQIVIAEHGESIADVPGAGNAFASDFTDEFLTARFAGKTLTDIQAMDNVLNGTTGATLQGTAPAIKQCLVNALGYYPLAQQYVDGIDAVTGGEDA